MAPSFQHSRELLLKQEVVFSPLELTLPNTLVYCNSSRFRDDVFTNWLHRGNISRKVMQPSVVLGRYPRDAKLDGAFSYLLTVAGHLIREQVAPWHHHDDSLPSKLEAKRPIRGHISHPCMLAARYGETTWGHWLLELLPKIVIAELVHPNLFTFVVPGHIARETGARSYATSILESLEAYGIGLHRLLLVETTDVVVFDNLFDIIDIASDGIHPGVIECLNEKVARTQCVSPSGRLAFLRSPAERRAIYNHRQVLEFLSDNRFSILDSGALTFLDQVAAFRSSEIICADLGSNLAGAVYAPTKVKALTTAPNGWRDGYFVNILQRLNAYTADVRGASTFLANPHGDRHIADSSYVISISDLEMGLHALQVNTVAAPANSHVTIDGLSFPRMWSSQYVWYAGWKPLSALLFHGGWSAAEEHHRWLISNRGSVEIEKQELERALQAAPTQLWLEFRGSLFTSSNGIKDRELHVTVNGRHYLTIISEGPVHRQVLLQKTDLQDGVIVSFQTVPSLSPLELGVSQDSRRLAFALESLSFGWQSAQ